MKTSVLSSPPAPTLVTTSWEDFPVPVPLASPFLQMKTRAPVRQKNLTAEALINIIKFTKKMLCEAEIYVPSRL